MGAEPGFPLCELRKEIKIDRKISGSVSIFAPSRSEFNLGNISQEDIKIDQVRNV
jgi:hypothetical protein